MLHIATRVTRLDQNDQTAINESLISAKLLPLEDGMFIQHMMVSVGVFLVIRGMMRKLHMMIDIVFSRTYSLTTALQYTAAYLVLPAS